MTHDELLAKITAEFYNDNTVGKKHINQHFALRAVVELHKPTTYRNKFTGEKDLYCPQCAIESGVPIDTYPMAQVYPCPTIQAIEEQLK